MLNVNQAISHWICSPLLPLWALGLVLEVSPCVVFRSGAPAFTIGGDSLAPVGVAWVLCAATPTSWPKPLTCGKLCGD